MPGGVTRTKSSGKTPARPKATKAKAAASGAAEGPKQTTTRGRRGAARVQVADDEPIATETPEVAASGEPDVGFAYVPPVMAPSFTGQLPRRRAVFFDVENTSRTEDIEKVLAHLALDFTRGGIEFMAVGNWRVIGHEPARILAAKGARLIHSAPATGVRDWSDLRIAVAAGGWIAAAQPGDFLEIVSDDQAFEAVGDEAAGRGIVFRRVSYRRLAGLPVSAPSHGEPLADAGPARHHSRGGRRSRYRGGGGRGGHVTSHPVRPHAPIHRSPAAPTPARAEPAADASVQTAPLDELLDVLHALLAGAPQGITLDNLANALKGRGFRRRSGSPRLITRLKLIKDIVIDRSGNIRFADGVTGIASGPVRIHRDDAPLATDAIEPSGGDDEFAAADSPHAADEEASDEEGSDEEASSDDAAPESAPGEAGPENGRRRRRRRGGRRRRGRRGGGGGAPVEAAAVPS
jgi:hypothetical protein